MAEVKSDGNVVILTDADINCAFDKTSGRLISVWNAKMRLDNHVHSVDVGCDGEFKLHTLVFHELDHLHTWELPPIMPNPYSAGMEYSTNFEVCGTTLKVNCCTNNLRISTLYTIFNGMLKISSEITNLGDERRIINGIAFSISNKVDKDAIFEFPANVPHGVFKVSDLERYKVIQSGQIAPFVHTYANGKHYNVIFLDQEEKWSTGVFKVGYDVLQYVNLAAVESYLMPGQTLYCGDMFIQLLGNDDPYLAVREFYNRCGWVPPADGISDGIMYSCHPSGTMDADFPFHRTMFEYTDELDSLKDMGIDHIWVLPIFDHKDRGVYHPADMTIIDQRYGGDPAVKYFSDKAHQLDMSLLFDFVPHGPNMDDEFARQHMEWAAVDREGHCKLEWDCLSFDMANPEYQRYMTDVVKGHIERFGIDGSRIDCAMGGLSNWRPYQGNRPSSSNLKGGVGITRAIRDAFVEMHKRPIILPENFNPVPFYYPYTDVFYDMPLYRTLVELQEADLTSEEYVYRLSYWLRAELLSTPKGLNKLRFLGNHDTVSWVWQKARATAIYGVDKAKALWAVMSFIDGIPMIYQGDEDLAIYGGQGPELKPFFKDLFSARKRWLGNNYDIEYIYTGTPIMAFKRHANGSDRLVLINLSHKLATCRLDVSHTHVLYGQCNIQGDKASIEGYGYAIIDIND